MFYHIPHTGPACHTRACPNSTCRSGRMDERNAGDQPATAAPCMRGEIHGQFTEIEDSSYITVKWSGFRTEVKCREWGLAHHVSNRGAHPATPQHIAHANSKIRNSRTTAGIAVSSCNSNNNSNRARSKSPFLWLSTHCSSSC